MAIKIQEKQTEIPVEIGTLNFSFELTDESIIAFRKNALATQKGLESLQIDESEDEEKVLQKAKDVLKKGFDLFLGEGAFDKIYAMTPSVSRLGNYFLQLVDGVSEEIENLGINDERAQKYIRQSRN